MEEGSDYDQNTLYKYVRFSKKRKGIEDYDEIPVTAEVWVLRRSTSNYRPSSTQRWVNKDRMENKREKKRGSVNSNELSSILRQFD